MDIEKFRFCFPFGSHLCREPMPPMSELRRDMGLLRRHGFNLIKLQEHWMIDEPAAGRVDLSRYEELIEHAAGLDLGVYVGLTCEQAPHWLYEKHPGCRMVRRDGSIVIHEAQTPLPADGKPGPCFDHPGAMADQLRFITELVKILGRFENVVVWNTWQEIGYWAEALVGGHVCYCDHTLNAYRSWLQSKYGDLDALNRAWNSRYADWADIVPDRRNRSTISAQEINWRYFMDNVQVANVLKQRAAAIKAADPLQRPVFAHKSRPALAGGQDWEYARCQDFLGSSCYPASNSLHAWDDEAERPFDQHTALATEMWSNVAYRFDHIRSANGPERPCWAAEFQGGPVSTGFHKGRTPSPDDMRRWMLTAVGAGVTGIAFWVTRAEITAAEVNGFSLLNSAGDETSRMTEAARIGQALNRYPDLFAQPTTPKAPVAILQTEINAIACSLLAQGGNHLQYAVRGWYRLLWGLGVPVDFITEHELADSDAMDYQALILPFTLTLSESSAEHLIDYVNRGGALISEAAVGRWDENAFCSRGELSPGMASLFGVEQTGFTMVREPADEQRWSPPERTWGEYRAPTRLTGVGLLDGHALQANVDLETYRVFDADPILKTADAVAGVHRKVGQGHAVLLGTFVGHSGTAYRNSATTETVRALLILAGVESQIGGHLLLRKRTSGDREAWIMTNPTREEITQEIPVHGGDHVHDLLGEPLSQTGNAVEVSVAPLDVRVLIFERGLSDAANLQWA